MTPRFLKQLYEGYTNTFIQLAEHNEWLKSRFRLMKRIRMVSDMSRDDILVSSDSPEVRLFFEESRGFCRLARFDMRPKRVCEYILSMLSV